MKTPDQAENKMKRSGENKRKVRESCAYCGLAYTKGIPNCLCATKKRRGRAE